MGTIVKASLVVLMIAVAAFGQHRRALIAPRPSSGGWTITTYAPSWRVDVTQFVGMADMSVLTNVIDLTGGGRNLTPGADDRYVTNATDGPFLGSISSPAGPGAYGYQELLLTTNAGGFVTNGTLAIRLEGGSDTSIGYWQTGTAGPTPARFFYFSQVDQGLYFDWGPDRITNNRPANWRTAFHNVIVIHDGAAMTVYMDGASFVTGASTNTLRATNTLFNFSLPGQKFKRALVFTNTFSLTDMTNLNNWMTTNSP